MWKIFIWMLVKNKNKIEKNCKWGSQLPLQFYNLYLLSDFDEILSEHLCLTDSWKLGQNWNVYKCFPLVKCKNLNWLSNFDEII